MAMDLKEIEGLIKEAMPDAVVEIQDLAGDGNHYSATVTSSQFSGKNKIEQHKMVYNSCLLYTSPSPRDGLLSRMPSSA